LSLRILDTDHLSLAQRRHIQVSTRLLQADLAQTAITIITVEEQLRGRFQMIKRAKSPEELIRAYKNLLVTFDSLKTFNILEFSPEAHAIHIALVSQKIRIGKQDLRIAAIALSVKGILVTRNTKDFSQIPDLALENWTLE
jgi:tRNA(fMet)-specific endonuclease VapC